MACPIGAVVLSVLGFNLLGDGLRIALDPVQRR
jgi:peptide/nickel transport system permease protein